jgi:ribosomal protein S18 acetylase RimI-like enzyme
MNTVRLRPAGPEDAPFIAEMVAESVSWDREPGSPPPAVADIAGHPRVADYFVDWPRPGDDGLVAEVDGQPTGACWYRRFTREHPGYGFLGEDVPGLGLAVRDGYRDQGIGTRLLAATVELARASGFRALSLSVADGNRARHLYDRAGFEPVELDEGGSWTMRLRLGPDPDAPSRAGSLIRDATHADAPAIVSLMHEMADSFGETSSASEESVLAGLRGGSLETIVAELDGQVVGVVDWFFFPTLLNDRPSAMVQDFSVAAARRDEGIGRALLAEALARIRRRDVAHVAIATGFTNERAQHLYHAFGFADDDLLLRLFPERR